MFHRRGLPLGCLMALSFVFLTARSFAASGQAPRATAAPSPPPLPSSPFPANATTAVPTDTLLKWNTLSAGAKPLAASAMTTGVQVLFFNPYTDPTEDDAYLNSLAAVRQHWNGFTSTLTIARDGYGLADDLDGKQAFVMFFQGFEDAEDMAYYGKDAGPVLRQFVQNGGLFVVCGDSYFEGCASEYLANAGLMNVTYGGSDPGVDVKLAASHTMTQGVSATFHVPGYASHYNIVGDAQVLVARASDNKPVAVIKKIGAGYVLLLGWNYTSGALYDNHDENSYSTDMGLLLANALRYLSGGNGAISNYELYFGTTNPPTTRLIERTFDNQCDPGELLFGTARFPANLDYQTPYHWKVVAHNSAGTTTGPLWSFVTAKLPSPPVTPASPRPADKAGAVALSPTLSWAPGAIPATFSVFLDTRNPPVTKVAGNLAAPQYTPAALSAGKTYYWQVVAQNISGSVASPVWSFATGSLPPAPTGPAPANGAIRVPTNNTLLRWNTTGAASTPVPDVNVLIFAEFGSNFDQILASMREQWAGFTTATTALNLGGLDPRLDPALLSAELAGKQVFLIPPPSYWNNYDAMDFAAAAAGVLNQFVRNGGLLVVCGGADTSSLFLSQAGLMDVTFGGWMDAASFADVTASHPFTQGLPAMIPTQPKWNYYDSVGDAQVLVSLAPDKPVVAVKKIGAGYVLLAGWNFTTPWDGYSREMGMLLTNAMKPLGTSSDGMLQYEVYFDTHNPPTKRLACPLSASQVLPGLLAPSSRYYWQVVARNGVGATAGPVWTFSTLPVTSVAIFSPAAGDNLPDDHRLTIDWQSDPQVSGTSVEFLLYKGGQRIASLGTAWDPRGEGLSTVLLPPLPSGSDYQIRAVSLWNPAFYGDSAPFTITGNPIKVLMPQGGERWAKGSKQVVSYKSNVYFVGTVIQFELWNGNKKVSTLKSVWDPSGAASAYVMVPDVPSGNQYYIRAVSLWDPKSWNKNAIPISIIGKDAPNTVPASKWTGYQ